MKNVIKHLNPKLTSKHFSSSKYNDRASLHTGAGVVLGTLFLPDFPPEPELSDPALVTRWQQAPDVGTGPATHTLYIDTTPGTRTPQSDTTHSQDKVHSPLLSAHVTHRTSGDLK